jgi:rubrerythrin
VRALQDEWRAESTYQAARTQLISVRLGNVVRMEQRHAAALVHVLEAHGNAVPAKPSFDPKEPGDAKAVCQVGVEAEKENIALYDELLKVSLPADVQCVFKHLQQVSRERHLPAFERCAS